MSVELDLFGKTADPPFRLKCISVEQVEQQ